MRFTLFLLLTTSISYSADFCVSKSTSDAKGLFSKLKLVCNGKLVYSTESKSDRRKLDPKDLDREAERLGYVKVFKGWTSFYVRPEESDCYKYTCVLSRSNSGGWSPKTRYTMDCGEGFTIYFNDNYSFQRYIVTRGFSQGVSLDSTVMPWKESKSLFYRPDQKDFYLALYYLDN